MKTILSLAAALTLSACASSLAPNWERNFGSAVRAAKVAQTINPVGTPSSARGTTDGKAVAGAQTAYSQSYGYGVKETKPAVVVMPTAGNNAR